MPHSRHQFPSIDVGMDGHVHTHLCNHAKGTMEEYVLAGISKGLHTICFLEHFEAGIDFFKRSWLLDRDFVFYFEEGERLRQIYGEKISILLGVEAGYNPEQPDAFADMAVAYPWDRIGLSCHFLRINDQHLNLLSRNPQSLAMLEAHGTKKVFAAYFSALLEALEYGPAVDIVCHLDAAMRHLRGLQLADQEYVSIDAILEIMGARQIALEINTSGFELRGEPFPNAAIIKKAIDYGIRLQLGSDAHSPDQVGRFFHQSLPFIETIAHPAPSD